MYFALQGHPLQPNNSYEVIMSATLFQEVG